MGYFIRVLIGVVLFYCFFQEQSDYEKERMKKIKENDLLLLKSGLVSVLYNH